MTDPTLHPRIREVLTALDEAQQEMEQVVAAFPAEFAQHEPNGQWSLARILEHLAIVEDGAGRLIATLIKQADGTEEADDAPVAPSIEHFQVWHPTRRIEAPVMVRPSGTLTLDEALVKQTTARARLRAALEKASGLALGSVSAPHPVLGALNGYQWALVTAQHQRRHVVQIRSLPTNATT